jgi:hypothetical protein
MTAFLSSDYSILKPCPGRTPITHNEAKADVSNNILGLRAQILGKHLPTLYSHHLLLDVSNTTQTMPYSSVLPNP